MIKISSKPNSIGENIKLRDYSEPLQNQLEHTSYSGRFIAPLDFGYGLDATNITLYENQMIQIWRAMSKNPYIDFAIDDIINEMISFKDTEKYPINIDLSYTSFSDKIREKIHEEWIRLQALLKFNTKTYTLLRDWFIDGKQYFYIMYSNHSITNIIALDPLRTKKMIDPDTNEEFYYYQDIQLQNDLLEFDKSHIIEVPSGLMDDAHRIWISYLNKAYIPLNQLNNIEDAILIYRIARAPERRVVYIDTGSLPKSKAETYMKEVIRNLKNKVEYDSSTGKIQESSLHMSLLDDIYLPRSDDSQGTEITTLQGDAAALSDLPDLEYFKRKLFRALNVPYSRWAESDSDTAGIGKVSEISRDELKYRKFIVRLRNVYNGLFFQLLKKQLLLKNIVTEYEFHSEIDNMLFFWQSDSAMTESRDLEILSERLNSVSDAMNYVGVFFSNKYIRTKILRQTDEEIQEIDKQIKEEENQEGGMPQPAYASTLQDPSMMPPEQENQEEKEPEKSPEEEKAEVEQEIKNEIKKSKEESNNDNPYGLNSNFNVTDSDLEKILHIKLPKLNYNNSKEEDDDILEMKKENIKLQQSNIKITDNDIENIFNNKSSALIQESKLLNIMGIKLIKESVNERKR